MKYEYKKGDKVTINENRMGGYKKFLGQIGIVQHDVSTNYGDHVMYVQFPDEMKGVFVRRFDRVRNILNK